MSLRFRSVLAAALVLSSSVCYAAKDEWVEVHSKHFTVITDDGEKSGKAVALRFEQMRASFSSLFQKATVNVPVPVQIIAFKNSKELRQYTPVWQGKPVELAGYFQSGEDRDFIAVDLSAGNGWAIVFHEYAHLLLNGNLKSLPLWVDEGYADFLSTLDVQGKWIALGTFPQGYGELLATSTWMKTADLLAVQHDSREYNEGSRRHIFYSQSWLTMHYMMMKHRMGELDKYINATRQNVPVQQAFQQAFGMTTEQFDAELHRYLSSRMEYLRAPAPSEEGGPYEVRPMAKIEKDATLADLKFHTRDHNAEGIEEFKQVLATDPNNATANRGLGIAYLRKRDFESAAPYIRKAAEVGSQDAQVHFYNAMLLSRSSSQMLNVDAAHAETVISEAKKAIEIDPKYAEAYNLLAYAESVKGNLPQAIADQAKAVELSPRNDFFLMNLATYKLRAEKWDEANDLLNQLKSSSNPGIAGNAELNLENIRQMREWQGQHPGGTLSFRSNGDVEATQVVEGSPSASAPEKGSSSIAFLKGKLVSIDCSEAPKAILEVKSGAKTWHMRVADRTHATLIGADEFSCGWANLPVAINYRELEPGTGELVSLELQ